MLKLNLLIITLIISSMSIVAQCMDGNCKNGYGIKKYDNGTYEGTFSDGEKTGWGCYIFNSGSINCGNWLFDKKELWNSFFNAEDESFYIGLYHQGYQQKNGIYVDGDSQGIIQGEPSKGYSTNLKSPEVCLEKTETGESRPCGYIESTSYGYHNLKNTESDFYDVQTGWRCIGTPDLKKNIQSAKCGHYDGFNDSNALVELHMRTNSKGNSTSSIRLVENKELNWDALYSRQNTPQLLWKVDENDKTSINAINKSKIPFDYSTHIANGSGCIEGDCENGTGTNISDDEIYQGRFFNGKRQGWGCAIEKENSEYILCGNWKDGMPQYLSFFFNNSREYFSISSSKDGNIGNPWGIFVDRGGNITYRTRPELD